MATAAWEGRPRWRSRIGEVGERRFHFFSLAGLDAAGGAQSLIYSNLRRSSAVMSAALRIAFSVPIATARCAGTTNSTVPRTRTM